MNSLIEKLKPLDEVRTDFKEWFNTNGQELVLMDLQTFIKLPFILQIGIWLQYLQDSNLQVVVYHRAWYIYYINKDKITHHENVDNKLVELFGPNWLEGDSYLAFNHFPMNYISNKCYEQAIFKGLEYINHTIKNPPF